MNPRNYQKELDTLLSQHIKENKTPSLFLGIAAARRAAAM